MTLETDYRSLPRWLKSLAVIAIMLCGVLLARLHNYLLFHWLVEFFSIVVAFGVFTVFWNSRRFLDNGCFLFIGIAYLFIGLVDLLHALAYDGMSVFAGGANLATQLWVVGRAIQASSFLAAPLFLRQRFDARLVLAGYTLAVSAVLLSIFHWQTFPTCFVAGEDGGLTPFKVYSEYVICLVMAASLLLLYRRRELLDPRVFKLLSLTIVLTIASELFFTFYTNVTEVTNLIGHCLKMVASYSMYVAFVEVGLSYPYAVVFRNLRESEQRLREVNETLEQRVAERTLVAEQRADQLRALASELTLTEQRERRRLAQALHDHLQQILVAAKLKVGMVKKRVEDEDHAARLKRVVELLDESIGVSRSLTVELSPPVLYDAGFNAALEWLTRHMSEKHGFRVVVVLDTETEPATDDLRVFLFDAVRELLFNVVKHGGISEAVVRVASTETGDLQVLVEDEGVGMVARDEETLLQGSGFGLFSIRERLEMLGGRMEIDSTVNQGTRIVLTVPEELTWRRDGHGARSQGRGPRLAAEASSVDGGSGTKLLRILLADDHKMFRKGLVNLLREHSDLEVVGEAGDGRTATRGRCPRVR